MHEKLGGPEIDYNAPVTTADGPMLAIFGVALEQADNEEWLEDFNRRVTIGSRTLFGCDPQEKNEIIASRIAIIDEFTALKSDARAFLSTATSEGTVPVQSNSILAAMRALYHNRHRVDALRVANNNTRVLLLDPKWPNMRLDDYEDLGLVPKKVAVAALTYPTVTVKAKLKDLSDLGLPATHIINSCPDLMRIDKARIQERLANFTDLGLDALKVATAAPNVLKYLPQSFRTKFLLLKAAFRYWGAADPRERALAFAEGMPYLFSNSPHRARTLIRLGSAILPPALADEVDCTAVSSLLVQDLNITLGAYLAYQHTPEQERPELTTVAEFCTFGRHTEKALGRAGLIQLIADNADDPIIQFNKKRKLATAIR